MGEGVGSLLGERIFPCVGICIVRYIMDSKPPFYDSWLEYAVENLVMDCVKRDMVTYGFTRNEALLAARAEFERLRYVVAEFEARKVQGVIERLEGVRELDLDV